MYYNPMTVLTHPISTAALVEVMSGQYVRLCFYLHNSLSVASAPRKHVRVRKWNYKHEPPYGHLAKISLSGVAQVRWAIMCTSLHNMDCVRVRVRVSVIKV